MGLLYGVAAFVGAALLFLLEPMIAKFVLPSFGGSPMVWTTSTLFFQVLLLAGYAYVHVATRWLGRRQAAVQLVLVVAAGVALPLALPADAAPGESVPPALWLLRDLALAAGLPFLLLATTGPLLQRWYSWSGRRDSDDPYFLYAASNAGSMAGLLAYPFLVEPLLTLRQQAAWWSLGYLAFALLTGALGVRLLVRKAEPGVADAAAVDGASILVGAGDRDRAAPVSRGRMLRWLALAFLPSTLMLGVTTALSTDIAAVPLLWVVPLAVYLATFVIAFGRRSRTAPRVPTVAAAVLAIVLLPVALGLLTVPAWAAALLMLVLLACVGLSAHGSLSADRPLPEHLTLFYLVVSLGGALGGLVNGLLAPVVFDSVLEYPIALVAVPLLLLGVVRPVRLPRLGRVGHWAAATWGAFVLVGLVALVKGVDAEWMLAVAVTGLLALAMVRLSGALVVAAVVLFVASSVAEEAPVVRERTFFGSYRVLEREGTVTLMHGTTIHGWEVRTAQDDGEPTSYYARSGPVGDIFAAVDGRPSADQVGVVGLGVGTVAAYGRSGQRFVFHEIDPAVVRLAEDPRLFTYLARTPASVDVVIGDGRLTLADEGGARYGLLLVDAFSSDAIPVHLLTREALSLYVDRTSDDGIVAVHITNRHLDLLPVVAAQARELGLTGLVRTDTHLGRLAAPSTWVALARDPAALAGLAQRSGWEPISTVRPGPVWTDDYSSLVGVLER